MGFLIGCASGLLARPRPPLGALSACVVTTAPAPGGADMVNQSALEGGEGVAEQLGGGWRLVFICVHLCPGGQY